MGKKLPSGPATGMFTEHSEKWIQTWKKPKDRGNKKHCQECFAGEFPGGPGVRISAFTAEGPGFNSWWGTKISKPLRD